MQKVNREQLLNELESVQPGLSQREIIEQSSCFVFDDGLVMTYNDEIACTRKCCLKIKGAVAAKAFTDILQKLPEDTIGIEDLDGEIVLHGKRRKCGITKEAEVLLPISSVEKPKDWDKLNEDFTDGIKLVQQCVSNDESQFALTCIHLTPKHVEACDNFQVTRVKMKTGVEGSMLIKKEALKHVATLDMTEYCQTESWMHYRNPIGLMLSCRRYIEDFPNLDDILDVEGSKAILPKGLADAADKAKVFASDTSDDSQVQVELRPGKLRIKGRGQSGWYTEVKQIKYNGPNISFLVSPDLLIEVTKRHNECIITDNRLMVNGGNFRYVTCLGAIEK